MRFLRLAITILATMLLGSGIAAAQEGTDPPPDPAPAVEATGLLAGVTLSCSIAAPSWVGGCWAERPVAVLGPVEVALGVDAQGDADLLFAGIHGGDLAPFFESAHLAPYAVLAYYGEASSFWAELRLPRLGDIPILGASDVLRVGFSHRFP